MAEWQDLDDDLIRGLQWDRDGDADAGRPEGGGPRPPARAAALGPSPEVPGLDAAAVFEGFLRHGVTAEMVRLVEEALRPPGLQQRGMRLDYYEALGLQRAAEATAEDVWQAYQSTWPLGEGDAAAEDRMRAFQTLQDPRSRSAYDALLAVAAAQPRRLVDGVARAAQRSPDADPAAGLSPRGSFNVMESVVTGLLQVRVCVYMCVRVGVLLTDARVLRTAEFDLPSTSLSTMRMAEVPY